MPRRVEKKLQQFALGRHLRGVQAVCGTGLAAGRATDCRVIVTICRRTVSSRAQFPVQHCLYQELHVLVNSQQLHQLRHKHASFNCVSILLNQGKTMAHGPRVKPGPTVRNAPTIRHGSDSVVETPGSGAAEPTTP
eukprot:25459-Chlamydomonas_euryale.AAC.3